MQGFTDKASGEEYMWSQEPKDFHFHLSFPCIEEFTSLK